MITLPRPPHPINATLNLLLGAAAQIRDGKINGAAATATPAPIRFRNDRRLMCL